MAIQKQELLKMIDQLPNEVDVEHLMQQLYLKAKLERSEQDIVAGRVLSHEQLANEVQQWGK